MLEALVSARDSINGRDKLDLGGSDVWAGGAAGAAVAVRPDFDPSAVNREISGAVPQGERACRKPGTAAAAVA
jgi:hypothetical protein